MLVALPLAASRNLSSSPVGGTTRVVPDILRLLADHEASIRFLREDARKCTESKRRRHLRAAVSVMRLHEKMPGSASYIENEPVHDETLNKFLR